MKLIRTISETQSLINKLRIQGKTLGFVPTMGALHEGHISLIRKAHEQNDAVAVSIFVNPAQFNDRQDFSSYPKNLKEDLEILKDYPVDLVFAPETKEIYPEPDTRVFNLGGLDKIMEGEHRPGHFNGVALVVSRLFEIIDPDVSYFGEKDFQQLAIIRKISLDLGYRSRIEGCPIIREADGLAMSSRNRLLLPEERMSAAKVSQALKRARSMAGKDTIESIRQDTMDFLHQDPQIQTEYFEIVDDQDLTPVSDWQDNAGLRGCIAVKIGRVRLIDNMDFSL